MGGIVIAAALVAYNNLVNRWPPFNRGLYVPMNVTTGVIVGAIAFGWLGLSPREAGLSPLEATDLLVGLALGAIPGGAAFLGALVPATRRHVADRRLQGLTNRQLLYYSLVRVPVGTAAFEEFCFRGVVLGLLASAGQWQAALASSAAFSLYHVRPATNMLDENLVRDGRKRAGVMAGTLAFTFIGGLALAWLRFRTDGVLAPLVVHATLNSMASVASVYASRHLGAGAA